MTEIPTDVRYSRAGLVQDRLVGEGCVCQFFVVDSWFLFLRGSRGWLFFHLDRVVLGWAILRHLLFDVR